MSRPDSLNVDMAGDAPAAPAASHGPARAARPSLAACGLCGSRRLHYAFSKGAYRIVRCADCRLLMINPQPSDAELATIYDAQYFLGAPDAAARERVGKMKAATARRYLAQIARYRGGPGGALLEIGCGRGELIAEAEAAGYEVMGVEISATAAEAARGCIVRGTVLCGELAAADLPPESFDVCVLSDLIEHVRDPLRLLRHVRGLLKPNGTLFIATPSLDSWSARLLRQNWMEFKPEHLSYFDTNTIQNALFLAGFTAPVVLPGWKVLNAGYVAHHFQRFPVPGVTPVVRAGASLLPRRMREADVPVVASGMVVLAGRAAAAPGTARRQTLSVIVPAYNEAATVATAVSALLARPLPAELDLEVILVESNSTDGTRQIVQQFAADPRVRLVLEDRPRGKGHAVRAGLARATGDFILIQDADLEYDFEDYDALLEPLIRGTEALALGSRHGGRGWWKMRKFTDQPLLALVTNAGHWVFTTLLNVLFRQRLRDPFTMFKVFRRDCLTGLSFQCDRFDFDIELLVKLIRKGYRPLEIPVNYRSRSYRQGKKVNMLRDPWTWVRALARLRLTRLDPLAELERQRRAQA